MGWSVKTDVSGDDMEPIDWASTKELELRLTSIPQVVLSPVSPVSPVVVLTVLVRLPLVTCADPVACSPLLRSGASGTSRSTRARSESS